MLIKRNRYYLSMMGIDIWLPTKKFSKKPLEHQIFPLCSMLNNELIGQLLLESFTSDLNEEVFKLLDAMLKAIRLRRDSLDQLKRPCFMGPIHSMAGTTNKFCDTSPTKPIVIVMGESLAQNIMGSQKNLDELREKNLYPYGQGYLLITYHPLVLLNQPHEKRKAWMDLKKVLEKAR